MRPDLRGRTPEPPDTVFGFARAIREINHEKLRTDLRTQDNNADVTVVMPAYNRASMIGRALDSVAGQTLAPREVVVIDDHSTDDTLRVAKGAGVTVLQTPENQGSGPARNLGIKHASTRWIAFLDSDDQWRPSHLETLFSHSRGVDLVSSSAVTTDGRTLGSPFETPQILSPLRVLESSELVVTSACMVRRESLIDAGLFRSLRRAQDLDMWVRVLKRGAGLAIDDRTVEYQIHDQQASLDFDLMMSCFGQIIESCKDEEWFDQRRDYDRIFARVHWDELRAAQAAGLNSQALREAAWFASHPAAWGALSRLLKLRRQRRSAESRG